MSELIAQEKYIPAMSPAAIAKVCALETDLAKRPQIAIPISHTLHGGVYTRTLLLPVKGDLKGVLTGALIKIATTVIVSGDVIVFVGDDTIRLRGYNVIPASANRKQAFIALTDTYITMIFETKAKTIKEAEDEFTDDGLLLTSRLPDAVNNIVITGE